MQSIQTAATLYLAVIKKKKCSLLELKFLTIVQVKYNIVILTDRQAMFLDLFFSGMHDPILIEWPLGNPFVFASKIRPQIQGGGDGGFNISFTPEIIIEISQRVREKSQKLFFHLIKKGML